MPYETRLRGPRQALTEFGRAALAGIGLNVEPVTGTSMPLVRTRAPMYVTPVKRRKTGRLTYSPRTGPTRSPNARMTATRPSRFRSMLGRRPYSYSSRRHTHEVADDNPPQKQMTSHRMIRVPWSENESLINARRGQLILCRGIKVKMWFKLKSPDTNKQPVQIRWAVIKPKDDQGGALQTNPADFFINADPANEMSKDWQSNQKAFFYHNRKINRDLWGVVKEGSIILSNAFGEPATGDIFSTHAYKKLNFYVPIMRQMKFDQNATTDAAELPDQNLQFCYWFCPMGDRTTGGGGAQGIIETYGEFTTYFTNSAMYK